MLNHTPTTTQFTTPTGLESLCDRPIDANENQLNFWLTFETLNKITNFAQTLSTKRRTTNFEGCCKKFVTKKRKFFYRVTGVLM